jgi:hypothetical protein
MAGGCPKVDEHQSIFSRGNLLGRRQVPHPRNGSSGVRRYVQDEGAQNRRHKHSSRQHGNASLHDEKGVLAHDLYLSRYRIADSPGCAKSSNGAKIDDFAAKDVLLA